MARNLAYQTMAGAVALGVLAFAGGAEAGPCTSGTDTSAFTFTGQIVTCTIPTTGIYAVAVVGANGGSSLTGSNVNDVDFPGGQGTVINAILTLSAGDQLRILVGGAGAPGVRNGNGDFQAGGGGGGTFIASTTVQGDAKLIIAGGGGGSGTSNGGMHGQGLEPSQVSGGGHGDSGADADGGAGGTSGNGGAGGSNGSSAAGGGSGAGGGGFKTDGGNSSYGGGGQSYLNGGAGGIGQFGVAAGGFGGGGSAGFGGRSLTQNGGGGGGGYSGGGGGGIYFSTQGGGGGGGSSFASEFFVTIQDVLPGGNGNTDGTVSS